MKVNIEVQRAIINEPTGIPLYVKRITRALMERGRNDYSLSFFDYKRERNNRAFIDKHFGDLKPELFECNSIHYGYLLHDLAYSNKNYNDYTGSDADLFHFPNSWNIPAKLTGKMVMTFHDVIPLLPFYNVLPYYNPNPTIHIGLERVYNQRPLIITGSNSAKEDMVKYTNMRESDIFVVYHGIDHDILYPDENNDILAELGIKKPYFLTVCSLDDPKKNIRRLVTAFESIAEKNKEVQLVLAGIYKRKDFKEFIENSKVRDRLVLTGFVSDTQRRILLSGASVFIYPSMYEGFGLPIVEAMACGAPVITSNTSSMPEAAGDAGILIDPYDTEQLAFEMERVLNSPQLRAELSKKGLEHSAGFTWDKAARETEQVYKLAMDSQ